MTVKYEELLGREYSNGKMDCYAVVRDFFKLNWGIELTDYARPHLWWRNPEVKLYENNYHKEGFKVVDIPLDRVEIGDCVLFCIGSAGQASHIAVYVGEGKFLHHFYNQRSVVEQLPRDFRRRIAGIIRHKDVPEIKPEKSSFDLTEDILKRTMERADVDEETKQRIKEKLQSRRERAGGVHFEDG